MIKSKTYNTTAGLDYIQAAELAFAQVYVVKRNGLQYDKYKAGSSANRTYIHSESVGKINFSDPFISGDRVFVMYKPVSGSDSGEIPGVCVPVEVTPTDMPDGAVNVSYSHTFPLSGTAPYFLNITSKPSWATIEVSLGGVITVMGFPDVAEEVDIAFDVINCGGTQSVSKSFTIVPNSENIFVVSGSFSRITEITGIPFTVTTGGFPVYLINQAAGIHSDYTGVIGVKVSNIIFPRTLRLIKNEVEIESISVTTNGLKEFASGIYVEGDVLKIYL